MKKIINASYGRTLESKIKFAGESPWAWREPKKSTQTRPGKLLATTCAEALSAAVTVVALP